MAAETAIGDENQAQVDITCRLHSLRPSADGHDAGAGDLDEADRNHERNETLDLVAGAGDLEYETLRSGVDDAGTERIRQPQRLDTVVAFAAYLDHCEFALDRGPG